MSEIKWAYDSNTGSFSALPASPFLLVALGALALLPLLEKAYMIQKNKPVPMPADFDWKLHSEYKERYKYLQAKKESGQQLDFAEMIELNNIKHPPWAKGGELWTYE
jgi:hypothetical protein